MNTPEEHAAAVLRAPVQITVASIAGAIRAYADEVKGSQIAASDKLAAERNEAQEGHRLALIRAQRAEEERTTALVLAHKVTAERDAEREARKALDVALRTAGRSCINLHHSKADRHELFEPCPVEARIAAALILASELP